MSSSEKKRFYAKSVGKNVYCTHTSIVYVYIYTVNIQIKVGFLKNIYVADIVKSKQQFPRTKKTSTFSSCFHP